MSAWADKYDAHVSALSGDGSRDNPYIIDAAADWAILSYSCGKQDEGELDFSGKYHVCPVKVPDGLYKV